jgi:hypothetical protein
MAEYWFRPKRYGYGATPVTWQGWVFTVVPGLIVVALVVIAAFGGLTSIASFLVWTIVAIVVTAVTAVVSYQKTDGEWRWRWGSDD